MHLLKGAGFLAILTCMNLGAFRAHADDQKDFRVYFIGNSVTDVIRYDQLAQLASSRGLHMNWGREMIPGAPLEWIYIHPNDGFEQEPFGHWPQALGKFPWDILSLQPFDRQLHDVNPNGEDMGDVPLITHFAELASKQNPDVQIYIYARWPRMMKDGKGVDYNKNDYDPTKPGNLPDFSKMTDYGKRWDATYTGGWDFTNESRDYFNKLLAEVRQKTPFLKHPPLLVPVGQVMAELHKKMVAGQIPGYTNIYDVYKDGIHLNEAGSYVAGCTYFATLFKQSPVGLPTTPYGDIKPDLAKVIQETVWDVVRSTPEAGVDAPATADATP
jgi:hypothetical protein